MPHECVSCDHVLEDGSDEVLEGCPECGGTTFSYVTEGVDQTPDTSPSSESTPSSQNGEDEETPTEDEILEAESSYERTFGGRLDDDADDGLTGEEDEKDEATDQPETSVPSTTAAEEARRELMDQFETIRIVEPGSYELNLMNLYEEDEKIIALQEDGRYQVSLPSGFDD